MAAETGTNPVKTISQMRGPWYLRDVAPLLVTGWAFWLPMVLLVYTLPSPLQFLLFCFALAGWSLLMGVRGGLIDALWVVGCVRMPVTAIGPNQSRQPKLTTHHQQPTSQLSFIPKLPIRNGGRSNHFYTSADLDRELA